MPVDPYYLSFIAKKNKITLDTVLAGRIVNNKLKNFIYNEIKKIIISYEKKYKKNYRVLISGITYKKNVADIRNSYALEIYMKLKKDFKSVFAYDKYCNKYNQKKYKVMNKLKSMSKYDLIVFLVDHNYNKKLFNSIKTKKIKYYDPFRYYL